MLSSLVRRSGALDVMMVLGLALAGTGLVWTFCPVPDIDADYFPRVRRAAFGRRGPRVLIDEAHGNTYTAKGRYQPFAHLLSRDGCRVSRSTRPFSQPLLQTADVLVIAGVRRNWNSPGLGEDELHAVRDWVAAGGALLLAGGFGDAADPLAGVLGFRRTEQGTRDTRPLIGLDRYHGIADHAIIRGRAEANEEIKQVMVFSGLPLVPPPDTHAFLTLPDSTQVHAVTLECAKGRVVVVSDPTILTAQRIKHNGQEIPFGINSQDFDNQQLALNIIHWLVRIL